MAQVDVATSSWRLTTIHLAHKGASSSHNIAWITRNRPFLSTGFDHKFRQDPAWPIQNIFWVSMRQELKEALKAQAG
jgi:hypothetical protein